jgi:two-component system, NtrC family, response regulator HupR/HoxA
MELAGTVLILSRTPTDWVEASALLSDRRGYRVLMAKGAAEAAASLSDAHIDLVIAENGSENGESVPFLARLRKSHPDIVRLLVVGAKGHVPQRTARDAAIYQFLHKPIDAEQLALVVQRGLEARDMMRRQRMLARDLRSAGGAAACPPWPVPLFQGEARHFESVVYVSEAMEALCSRAAEAAATDLPVLLQGEAGTGKQWLARAIHAHSPRHAGPFLVQKCGGLGDAQLLAALFGSAEEARTSHAPRTGLLHAAEGGSLFLDEIGETSRAFQTHLLRFLERGESDVLRGGGEAVRPARLIAGSVRAVRALAAKGEFRQELYIRLRGFELDVPPLRDRPEDIPVLAEAFIARHSAAGDSRILGISASALERLAAYDFPGNVGELESEIRRMVAVAKDGEYLTSRMMSPAILEAAGRELAPDAGFAPAGSTLKDKVESLERHILREALQRHKWNRSRVAEALGLSRVGLANKIRRYRLNEHR